MGLKKISVLQFFVQIIFVPVQPRPPGKLKVLLSLVFVREIVDKIGVLYKFKICTYFNHT